MDAVLRHSIYQSLIVYQAKWHFKHPKQNTFLDKNWEFTIKSL